MAPAARRALRERRAALAQRAQHVGGSGGPGEAQDHHLADELEEAQPASGGGALRAGSGTRGRRAGPGLAVARRSVARPEHDAEAKRQPRGEP